MDLRLPDLDGLEVVRRMRASADAKKVALPIIVQSAHVLASDIEACVAAGVDEFVGKPFKLERLQAALRRVASPAALRRSARRAAVGADCARRAANGGPKSPPNAAIDESVLAEHVDQLGFEQTARIVAAFEASVASAPAEIERLAQAGERRALAASRPSAEELVDARWSRPPVEACRRARDGARGKSQDVVGAGGRARRCLSRRSWRRSSASFDPDHGSVNRRTYSRRHEQ